MAVEKIVVKARIEAVVSSVPTHKIVRDPEGEKRVKEDLEKRLKAEGLEAKPDSADFKSRYRAKLRDYAAYADGVYVEKDPKTGGPVLMVTKRVFQNELKLRYSVDGKDYTQTINYDTLSKCLEKGGDFYITVDRKQPLTVLKGSVKDYRPADPIPSGSNAGFYLLLILGLLWVLAQMKGWGT